MRQHFANSNGTKNIIIFKIILNKKFKKIFFNNNKENMLKISLEFFLILTKYFFLNIFEIQNQRTFKGKQNFQTVLNKIHIKNLKSSNVFLLSLLNH